MELSALKELGVFGAAGLMFLAYYVLHQSTFSVIKAMMEQLREANTASIKEIADSFERISESQKQAEERNYQSLKELTESLQMTVAAIGRLETKISGIESGIAAINAKKGGR